ncbi:hypothetical protein BC829DRAFT_134980 [Chytridium lagenaria]|nr:hypothetical protein BC829DRAFT_134980 [Chytridium lagenaria]
MKKDVASTTYLLIQRPPSTPSATDNSPHRHVLRPRSSKHHLPSKRIHPLHQRNHQQQPPLHPRLLFCNPIRHHPMSIRQPRRRFNPLPQHSSLRLHGRTVRMWIKCNLR